MINAAWASGCPWNSIVPRDRPLVRTPASHPLTYCIIPFITVRTRSGSTLYSGWKAPAGQILPSDSMMSDATARYASSRSQG